MIDIFNIFSQISQFHQNNIRKHFKAADVLVKIGLFSCSVLTEQRIIVFLCPSPMWVNREECSMQTLRDLGFQ